MINISTEDTIQPPPLSDLVAEMAMQLIRRPSTPVSDGTLAACLMMAASAWNAALGDDVLRRGHHDALARIARETKIHWSRVRSSDTEALIDRLIAWKQKHHPQDTRQIVTMERTPEGILRVQWHRNDPPTATLLPVTTTPASQPVPSPAPRPAAEPTSPAPSRQGPIAASLLASLKRHKRKSVVDLGAYRQGTAQARELAASLASRDALDDLHPAHGPYVAAQNILSMLSEQLTSHRALMGLARIIERAEQRFEPGEPSSPVTVSYFTLWAMCDVVDGEGAETIASLVLALGPELGLDATATTLIGALSDSRMGLHRVEKAAGPHVVLRELVTGHRCEALCPSGHVAAPGELWFARVLPPALPGPSLHVVFNTPYVLRGATETDWLEHLNAPMIAALGANRSDAYTRYLKFGTEPTAWLEFIQRSCVGRDTGAVYLRGLPTATRPPRTTSDALIEEMLRQLEQARGRR